MKKDFILALKYFAFFTFITGFVYPLLTTVIGQSLFSKKVNGSLIQYDGEIRGSYLIGQKFSGHQYFWGRPSANDYNPMNSGASQLSMTSKTLQEQIEKRKSQGLRGDLLFASGSGLDPHISLSSALAQEARVLRARHKEFDQNFIKKLHSTILDLEEYPDFYIFGQKRINVLKLNLALDALL